MRQRKINLISVLAATFSNICMYGFIYMGFHINWLVCLLAVCFAVAVKIVVAILFYNDTDDYFNVPLFANLFSFELTLPLEIMIRTSSYIITKVKAYIDNDNPTQG